MPVKIIFLKMSSYLYTANDIISAFDAYFLKKALVRAFTRTGRLKKFKNKNKKTARLVKLGFNGQYFLTMEMKLSPPLSPGDVIFFHVIG